MQHNIPPRHLHNKPFGPHRQHILRCVAFAVVCLFLQLTAQALPVETYARTSRLASGNWARVEVSETGMQLISNATLKNLGFPDPSKVNVYGSGGRVLPENLTADMTDDLPKVASIQTAKGILFFGHSNISWSVPKSATQSPEHKLNPYSDYSYYFISDVDPERKDAAPASGDAEAGKSNITTFTERIVHEKDQLAPSNTGRLLLGEDFRTAPSQSFTFQLPGNTGNAKVKVCLGAKVSNGSATLGFSANGTQLAATSSDKIAGITNGDTFLSLATTTKSIENPGEKLTLGINFSYSGTLFTAALDYIAVEYPRSLSLKDNELYFKFMRSGAATAVLEGCTGETVIWDVTDAANPRMADFVLEGTTAKIRVPSGYSEFAAFNPEKIQRGVTPSGKIQNQDLHGMEAPDMLIISPAEYRSAALRIAAIHEKADGMTVAVVDPQQIYNEFSSGARDVTAFRKLLKMWYDRRKETGKYTEYCLLMGRASFDQKEVTPAVRKARYPRLPIWQSENAFSILTSYSTDDYIGMLDDNDTPLNMGSAKIRVAVGRLPVKSSYEAENMAKKLERYILEPVPGNWRNHTVVIADDQDNGVHLNQGEGMVGKFRSNQGGNSMFTEKLYLDAYDLVMSGTGATYPEPHRRLLAMFSEGVNLINYIGHAHEKGWGHEQLLTWPDITGMTNTKLPVVFAATCNFLNWDANETSGGEELWLEPNSGIIAMICPSRKVYISLNGTMCANFASSCFDSEGMPKRIGEALRDAKNATPNETNKLRYCMMGDPAMRLQFPAQRVSVENIAGKPAASGDNPVLPAFSRHKVSGTVLDVSGDVDENFNGELTLLLYDAEKTVDTKGNGSDGVVSTYNDRNTMLFTSKAKVTAGRWETEIIIPLEIENNFSPALLSLYAHDPSGREASGAFDKFYVHGFNTDADPDTEGPMIEALYLNEISFREGSSSGPSPVVYASFSDASGINLSEAGIGHGMTLSLDGKTTYSDVAQFYEPDSETIERGHIAYPLSGIEPGSHTLTLTVWDNAGNSSSRDITFQVNASWMPSVTSLSTNASPAHTDVNFLVTTDGSEPGAACRVEVFSLSGRKVWESAPVQLDAMSRRISINWNLRDRSGHRVPRGLYIYRAIITSAEGAENSRSSKLPVAAQ